MMIRNTRYICGMLFIFALATSILAQHEKKEFDDWYFRTDDTTTSIYVREIGSGEPFVVLHGGFGAEHSYLLRSVEGLESRFRFIFYDQRGSLRSPTAIENISVERHVQDIEALRMALGLERINILGHSKGTLLAMHYLREYPEHTGKLVLVGALYPRSGTFLSAKEKELKESANKALAKFAKREEVAAEFRKFGMAGAEKPPSERTGEENKAMASAWAGLSAKQKAQLDKISSSAPNIYYVERWNQAASTRPYFSNEAGNAAIKTLDPDYDFVPDLQKHKFPVTMINGDHDLSDFGNKQWDSIADDLKNVRIEVIKSAGHNIWIDQPVRFKEILGSALSRD